jgi:hypothetical protein
MSPPVVTQIVEIDGIAMKHQRPGHASPAVQKTPKRGAARPAPDHSTALLENAPGDSRKENDDVRHRFTGHDLTQVEGKACSAAE